MHRPECFVRGLRRFQSWLVVVTAGMLAASFYGAEYLYDQPWHHGPTIAALAGLYWLAVRGGLSNASALAIHGFLWLHILGARYIYSFVPYDDWVRACCGHSLSEMTGWERNHYDRLVHFMYGALATVPQVDLLRRRLNVSMLAAHAFSFMLVLSAGAAYEILEWSLAMIVAPEWAERYNGQQGDVWDPQKDMSLAAAGAALASLVMWVARGRVRG